MKFMRIAENKDTLGVVAPVSTVEHWELPSSSSSSAVVVVTEEAGERLKSGTTGRRSFGNFNPEVEKHARQMKEQRRLRKRLLGEISEKRGKSKKRSVTPLQIALEAPADVSVEEMAQTFGRDRTREPQTSDDTETSVAGDDEESQEKAEASKGSQNKKSKSKTEKRRRTE